jgi:hypothetical protein
MGIVHGLFLIVLGGLGASTLVARREEGRKALAALEPYQGWIGVVAVAWGAWLLVEILVGFRRGQWILSMVDAGLLVCLGLLLGVGILKSFVKDPAGQENFDRVAARITPYRQTLGVVAMVLGALLVLGLGNRF